MPPGGRTAAAAWSGNGMLNGPIFAPEEAGGVKCLEFLAFADVEALADVDEGRHGRIARTQRAGDDRTEMRRGDRLRRGIAGVPLILMPRVQDEPEIARRVTADQRAAIHHPRQPFQAPR